MRSSDTAVKKRWVRIVSPDGRTYNRAHLNAAMTILPRIDCRDLTAVTWPGTAPISDQRRVAVRPKLAV
jgi:hypothetical protein